VASVSTKVEFDVLATDKASTKLDKIANSFDKLGDKAGNAGDKATKGLDKLKKGISKAGAGMLVAGVAVGALFVKGLTEAMDIQDANAKLAASLGFNEKQSAKSGKIAGDLYKGAWGDSVADIDDVLAAVFQTGLAKITDGEDAIKNVTAAVMDFSKISKEEALPVTRAVAQMLKTGLAKNATEAFDILTRGQQLGINKSEDLLDTFNEYGTQFRKLGLSGQDALGLINQLLQGGARDADTAADAIKEFSIRAIDGSDATAEGFKALGLDADKMAAAIAKGGPAARTAFGDILDGLNGIKDPVKREAAGVALFGTKWEDLGASVGKADLDTAAASLGKVGGAAKAAGDTLNDTARTKFTAFWRTLKMTVVDAIGKFVLPKLEQFADWFAGPGKFVMASWALEAGSAMIDFADKTLGALQSMMGGLAKYARVALIAAAGSVAVFNPGQALNMLKQADALGEWAEEAKTGIGNARKELQGWKGTLDKTNTKVKIEANIADLERKLKTAKTQLADRNLTKERRAQLTATKKDLDNKLNAAYRQLGNPALTKARVAQLQADKTDLDNKLNAALRSLRTPGLTATKRAQIQANIADLQSKIRTAQGTINNLKGKTVVIKYTATGVNLTAPSSVGRREHGGPVKKGQPYIVGEKRPEVFVPDQNGTILPKVPDLAAASQWDGGGRRVEVHNHFPASTEAAARAAADRIALSLGV
jgi:hypothetical protein